ncbi:MAG: CsgG/HfaB family protein [Tunicatimonas sp.]|uniref:CsgG/HfaB family protein n=1 Tax=Tunicatimonas sp. TaxID=1940096 RepID=UPI003C70C1A2
MQQSQARLGSESGMYEALTSLPEPREKVVAAVYKFRDQTGQYQPTEVGASWSTAVTQGATSILLRALEESGWYTTIEREGLSNLLNERKIIRSSRQAYNQQQGGEVDSSLPPLLYAGVILEGGIISYDANTMTGGAGARYFGVGGSAEYRQDRVTVYLRATSTSTGRILKTVYTSRTILSQKLDAGLFKFVSFQRILEAETGFTYNEPTEIAVREAIEKAVHSLTIEGIQEGLWNLKYSEEINAPVIQHYLQEAEVNPDRDFLGRRRNQFQRGSFAVGGSVGTFRYAGDYPNPLYQLAGEAHMQRQLNSWFSLGVEVGRGTLAGEGFYQENFNYALINTVWRTFPEMRFSPHIRLAGGAISAQSQNRWLPKAVVGLGAEYLINNTVGLQAGAQYHYVFSDELDQMAQGRFNDFFWSANVGINLYFGRKTR